MQQQKRNKRWTMKRQDQAFNFTLKMVLTFVGIPYALGILSIILFKR
jgi:hypothetical protein